MKKIILSLTIYLSLISLNAAEKLLEGKTIREWLNYAGKGTEERAQAEKVLRGSPTNVIPTLLEMLLTKDTHEAKERLKKEDRQGYILYRFTPQIYNLHQEALFGFFILGSNAVSAVPVLAGLVVDSEHDGIEAIESVGQASEAALIRALSASDPKVRSGSAIALGLVHASIMSVTNAIPALVKSLEDKDVNVRLGAANSLGSIRSDTTNVNSGIVVPALSKSLSDNDPRVRRAAADSLIQYRAEAKSAVSVLLKAIEDKDKEVRYWAAFALAEIDPNTAVEKVVPIFLKAVKEENSFIAEKALFELRKIAPDAAEKAGMNSKDPSRQKK